MNTRPARLTVLPYRLSPVESDLQQRLQVLKENYACCGIKLSTEDAAMGFEQIGSWVRMAGGILPIVVKIGGPNARNDIRQLMDKGVDGFIAPMVESAYGLENFLDALKDYCPGPKYAMIKKQINIETKVALENLDSILENPGSGELDEITIGCTDLSKSLKTSPDDPDLQIRVRSAINTIQSKGFPVSLGGSIHPGGIDDLLSNIRPQRFNTRILTFQTGVLQQYRTAVSEALKFEIAMLRQDREQGFISEKEEVSRIGQLESRLKERS